MKSCRRRNLESIVGLLNHACKAVRAGRSFKRRLQDLMATVDRDNRRVRLNVDARAELEWWYQFGTMWNGTAMMRSVVAAEQPQVELVSDTSGSWGCGAAWMEKWFQLSWCSVEDVRNWSIAKRTAADCDSSSCVGQALAWPYSKGTLR